MSPSPVTFKNPPVQEVILSSQFSGPDLDEVDMLAKFWNELKDEYPRYERQIRIPPVVGEFDDNQLASELNFSFGPGSPPPRYWFMPAKEEDLIQVQGDRLVANWRKQAGTEYPRYEHVRERFSHALQTLVGSVDKPLMPDICEVTYVNEIPTLASGLRPLGSFLDRVSDAAMGGLPEPENEAYAARVRLEDRPEFRSRLYLLADPVQNRAGKDAYKLELTVRGQLAQSVPDAEETCGKILDFFDYAREIIVNTFRDVTTESAHAEWEILEDKDPE